MPLVLGRSGTQHVAWGKKFFKLKLWSIFSRILRLEYFYVPVDLRLNYSYDFCKNVEGRHMTAQFLGVNHVTLSPHGNI